MLTERHRCHTAHMKGTPQQHKRVSELVLEPSVESLIKFFLASKWNSSYFYLCPHSCIAVDSCACFALCEPAFLTCN